jgi:linoleoyl-CoA desaturase
MKSYLKRKLSYGEAKSPKTLWTTLIITKVIYVSIWIGTVSSMESHGGKY